MDKDRKKDLIRTALIVAGFMLFGLAVLNILIGNAMSPEPPRL